MQHQFLLNYEMYALEYLLDSCMLFYGPSNNISHRSIIYISTSKEITRKIFIANNGVLWTSFS